MEGICAHCRQTFIYDENKPGPKPQYCPGHRQAAYHHRKSKKTAQPLQQSPIHSQDLTIIDATSTSPSSTTTPRTFYLKRHKLMHDSCGHYICSTCGQSWTTTDIIQKECPLGPVYNEQSKPDYLVDGSFLQEHSLYPYGDAPDAYLDLGKRPWYVCLYDKRKAIPRKERLVAERKQEKRR